MNFGSRSSSCPSSCAVAPQEVLSLTWFSKVGSRNANAGSTQYIGFQNVKHCERKAYWLNQNPYANQQKKALDTATSRRYSTTRQSAYPKCAQGHRAGRRKPVAAGNDLHA
eukprot:478774-Prorocentrum_minimum.AAC.5